MLKQLAIALKWSTDLFMFSIAGFDNSDVIAVSFIILFFLTFLICLPSPLRMHVCVCDDNTMKLFVLTNMINICTIVTCKQIQSAPSLDTNYISGKGHGGDDYYLPWPFMLFAFIRWVVNSLSAMPPKYKFFDVIDDSGLRKIIINNVKRKNALNLIAYQELIGN